MLAEYKTKTNVGVGLGIVLQLLGRSLTQNVAAVGMLMILAGTALFIYGCFSYAKGKGQSQWLGLLGLASIFGLIVLVLLPDKHK